MYKKIKKSLLLIVLSGAFSSVSAQAVLKLGGNPYTINDKAALDVESTTRGFLPPRMTKVQRNAITSPPPGLQVWCTDCNVSTEPASGLLCIYMGNAWAPLQMNTTASVTTGKKSDTNKPVVSSLSSATINGKLIEISGAVPTETGVVYKLIGTDFGTLPLLDAGTGNVSGNNSKKATGTAVTTEGADISVAITGLSEGAYYYRTYAKSYLGIGYGNPVVLSCSRPVFNAPAVTGGATLTPKFSGSLKVYAGTLKSWITEYGYVSGASSNPTGNKVVLSTPASLAALSSALDTESFTSEPLINLNVDDYYVDVVEKKYFRYYAVVDGSTIYSSEVSFTPTADAVSGGSAIIEVVSKDLMSPAIKYDQPVGTVSSIVHINIIKKGTFTNFVPVMASSATSGITMATIPGGTFANTGNFNLTFNISGTPGGESLQGNTWSESRLGDLGGTGAILKGDIQGMKATCESALYNLTTVVPVVMPDGRTWMDRNLGASRAGASTTDKFAYGCTFQWGRGNDGHASVERSSDGVIYGSDGFQSSGDNPGKKLFITNAWDWRNPPNAALWQGVSGVNNPCPSGYRLPTGTELGNVLSVTNVVNGNGAFNNGLKLTFAGRRTVDFNAPMADSGSSGTYWTSTTVGDQSHVLVITSSSISYQNKARSGGYSVRCIKD